MKNPRAVGACCEAMKKNTSIDVTVKCRIGVDDQDPEEILPEFLSHISNSGVRRVIIHARKAILKGLSPKENRDVPPLDYEIVFKMKLTSKDEFEILSRRVENLEKKIDQLKTKKKKKSK